MIAGLDDPWPLGLLVWDVELILLFKFSLSLNVAVSFFRFRGEVDSSAKCKGIWLSLSVMRSGKFIEDRTASPDALFGFIDVCDTWNSPNVFVLGRNKADDDLVVDGWEECSVPS